MQINKFEHTADLESALLVDFSNAVKAAIHKYGDARVLLSGGSTPMHFYEQLSQEQLPWHQITVGLVDERYVLQGSEYSNESQITAKLKQNAARQLEFLSMVYNIEDENLNLQKVHLQYKRFFERIDFTLLGMGSDGHTASLFPGDEVSERILHSNEIGVYNTVAPNFPNKRITCSKALLLKSEVIAVMIQGENKYQVLTNVEHQDLPIHSFLMQSKKLKIYYS